MKTHMIGAIKMEYKTVRYEQSLPVKNFVETYVDIPKFLDYCRQCNNYDMVWSCPEYDFDPMDIWNRYRVLDLTVVKVAYGESDRQKDYTKEELTGISVSTLLVEKNKLMNEFMAKEKEYEEAFSLAAGSCDGCGRNEDNSVACAKRTGETCRHPDELRYSVESLGGDVVKAANELFDIDVKWSDGSSLPEYFILMCGILRK